MTGILDRPNPGSKSVSVFIKCHSKCNWMLENEHRNPIIKRIHDPTNVNGCTKYEHNPLNSVGCRVVTRAGRLTNGRTDGLTDGRTDSAGHDNTLPNGPGVKIVGVKQYITIRS